MNTSKNRIGVRRRPDVDTQRLCNVPGFMHGAYWRFLMPYCLRKLDLPGHVWLTLNRDYKPLGTDGSWVDYEDYADQAIVFARDPAEFNDVWLPHPSHRVKWLYDDSTSSSDYYRHLANLQWQPQRAATAEDLSRWQHRRIRNALRAVQKLHGRKAMCEVLAEHAGPLRHAAQFVDLRWGMTIPSENQQDLLAACDRLVREGAEGA